MNTESEKVYVANGEQGRVKAIFSHYMVVELQNPLRVVRVPFGKSAADETESVWDLAYAISVHRAQGSEWPVVLVVLDSYPGAVRLCDRHWLYTAVSRAKRWCGCIGKRSVAIEAVSKSHMWNRKTLLKETIEELRRA